jgi:hypothetical protein
MFSIMNDRAVIRSFETGQGKRLAILALAVAILALVIGVVAFGFRDRHITRNADALMKTEPAPPAARHFPSR